MRRILILAILISVCFSGLWFYLNARNEGPDQKLPVEQTVDAETVAAVAEILAMVEPTKTDILLANLQIKFMSKNGPYEPWLPQSTTFNIDRQSFLPNSF